MIAEGATKPIREWEDITMVSKILGISDRDIRLDIQNGEIPFRKSGSHYRLNIELVREAYKKKDIENMRETKGLLNAAPFSEHKTTKNIGKRNRANPNIKRVDL